MAISQCPKCGYTGEMPGVMRIPMWVLGLKSIVFARSPIFGGLLERDVWREDADIVNFVEHDWIEPVGKEGFRITPKGRAAYAELAKQYNLPS